MTAYVRITCPLNFFFLCNQIRKKKTISIANDSYNCVGCSFASIGTPVTSWPSSVKRTPQGKVVGLPQQQPAEKHPCRPSTFPSAIPGAQASAVFHHGNFQRRIRKYPVMIAPSSPP